MQPRQKFPFSTLILASAFVFSGCGSLSKDAKKLMETGNYEAAIHLWDQVIAKDPNDAEATFYRNLAQGQLLNEDLITLKGLIDSHQTLLAFDQLKKFHQKRAQWGLGLNPNSSLYLRTQTDRLYVRYLELNQQALQKSQVLRGLWIEKQYRPLLDLPPNEDEIKIKNDLQALGEKKCATLDQESRKLPYLRYYATLFCKRFGKSLPYLAELDQKRNAQLHQLKSVQVHIEALTPNEVTELSDRISSETKRLAKYSSQGKVSEGVTIGGTFARELSEKLVPMSHSYEVSIPYTDYELVSRYKSIPYTASEEHCVSDGSRCWSESVTRYRQEEEKESVAVTKLRSEPRVYEFNGQQTTQKFELQMELVQSVNQKTIRKIPFSKNFEEKVLSHDKNLLQIGLSPIPLKLTERDIWLKNQFAALATRFYNTQVDSWKQELCVPNPHAKKWIYLDQALHCLQQSEASELDWIQQSAQDHEGLSTAQISEIIGPIAI